MTARDFCYWLQGYFELQSAGLEKVSLNLGITHNAAVVIKRHLDLVFAHEIDPAAGGPEVQKKLNAIHNGTVKDAVMRC